MIFVNPILKEESRWVRQLQYTYGWLRPRSDKKELDALYIWCQVGDMVEHLSMGPVSL